MLNLINIHVVALQHTQFVIRLTHIHVAATGKKHLRLKTQALFL